MVVPGAQLWRFPHVGVIATQIPHFQNEFDDGGRRGGGNNGTRDRRRRRCERRERQRTAQSTARTSACFSCSTHPLCIPESRQPNAWWTVSRLVMGRVSATASSFNDSDYNRNDEK